jgi:outer membrane protein assembly factor BamA
LFLKRLIVFSLSLLLLGACNYYRYVPEEEYLLWENKIIVKDGSKVLSGAESVLKQQPNNWLFSKRVRPSLGIYTWGGGNDSSFFGNLGNKPVVFDANSVRFSERQLENYYFNQGFFDVEISSEVSRRRGRGPKARVFYYVNAGKRYRVDSIDYIVNAELSSLVNHFSKESYLKKGMFYQSELLEKERTRLRNIFRNHGYYNFAENYINFIADTVNSEGPQSVILSLNIPGIPRRQGDSTVYQAPRKHLLNQIEILPDFDFSSKKKPRDSTQHKDYILRYDSLKYKARYLTDAIHLEPRSTFSQKDLTTTYSHLAQYNAFKVTEISFTEIVADTGLPKLNAVVRLVPKPKRSINFETEASNTSGNFGINASVGVLNRNVFNSGEALRFDINTGLEYQPTLGQSSRLSRTFELGAELAIDFPRFLLPFNTEGVWPKRMKPQSSLSLFANRTTRIEFDRETYGARINYQWDESEQKHHEVSLFAISYSNLFSIDSNFIQQLDPIQALAFNSEFITSTSWDFSYTGQKSVRQRSYSVFKSNLEVAGTLQSLFVNLSNNTPTNENGLTLLYGAPVYQFARLEVDFRQYLRIDRERAWVYRISSGYVLPYGNSLSVTDNGRFRLPPFSRFFFLGGTNDIRAWPAYRAGGGRDQVAAYSGNNASGFAIGTFKLISNLEYRFPLYSSLKGAVFMDAGNIWLTGGLQAENPDAGFEWSDWYEEIYLGSGFGLRLDLDFFVIRFDTGIRLYDPGFLAQNEQWVITNKAIIPNLTYNIALGYPF